MQRKAPKKALAFGSGLLAALLLLSGCSSPSASSSQASVSQADIDKAMKTPTTLTFWSWVPHLQDEVNLFEKKYPAIKVDVQNVGQGGAQYTKLRTALKAGKGAPDVAQVEYQYVSSFTLTGSLLDLSAYGAGSLKSQFVPWVWDQVSQSNHVYGIPQDSGPMGNLYRQDILAKAGITSAPSTWDQYAEDATKIKATGSYISNLAPNDPGQLMALLWQAGLHPFGYDGGKNVTVDVASSGAKKVLTYWQKLIQAGTVSVDPDFTDQWYQGLANGKYAGWLTAAWGPVFLQGTAGGTSGKWRASALPAWSGGASSTGNWGGSSDAVVKGTKNPIAAYELAKFINTDHTSTIALANKQFLFPTTTSTLSDASFSGQKSAFYGGQTVNQTFAGISSHIDTKFQWLPYMDYAYSSFNDTVGKAIADKADLSAALDTWQGDLKTYGTQQGFTVK